MDKTRRRVDEIVVLGAPVRTWKGKGEPSPGDEARLRDEVARFTIGSGQDFDPPPFVERGLRTGGWMLIRKPVESLTVDLREPEPEPAPAVEEPEAAEEPEPVEEPVEDPEPKPEKTPVKKAKAKRKTPAKKADA